MSTLSNIFAADDADQAASASPEPSADEANIEPGTPGYEPDNPNDPSPPVLMPGGEDDPQA